jgi:hypothetical protein
MALSTRTVSDVGVAISEAAGGLAQRAAQGLLGSDLYEDGTAVAFGSFNPVGDLLCVFSDSFDPYAPPVDEPEAYYTALPFLEAERKLAETEPIATGVRVSCAWHGLVVDNDRGAVVLVRDGGELEPLIGERVRITPVGKRIGKRSVYAFVHGKANLDPQDELSASRRIFLAMGPLGLDRLPVVVETLK